MLTLKQIAERKKAIGGSDIPHLVGLEPFGCQRRLWYDKKGVPEDFPQQTNRHMKRGSAMEEFAVTEYYETTARHVRRGIPWKLDDGGAPLRGPRRRDPGDDRVRAGIPPGSEGPLGAVVLRRPLQARASRRPAPCNSSGA
jgi:hypothetical protein